jgi:hypothetical protein
VFVGSPGKHFDTRLLDHRGLVLIAEMREPVLEFGQFEVESPKGHRSSRLSLTQQQQNYNTRVLANVRSQHNEFAVGRY